MPPVTAGESAPDQPLTDNPGPGEPLADTALADTALTGGPVTGERRTPALPTGNAALTRLLPVEVLLADPETLGNDALEGDLYILRDHLRTRLCPRHGN